MALYDHTVLGLPRQHPNFSFYQEALGEHIQGVSGGLAEHLQRLAQEPCMPPGALLKAVNKPSKAALRLFKSI